MKMKHLFPIITLFCAALAACGDSAKPADKMAAPGTPTVNLDSAGTAQGLHAFFVWYAKAGEQQLIDIDFVNDKGKHPVLDEAMLDKYLAVFTESGTVSPVFVENEKKFYHACAELWKEEESGDIPSGFDADRAYCAQDGDVTEFSSAPVSAKISGDFATVQLLLDPNGPNGGPRSFEMKKENGKWLLSKFLCDSGVEVK